MSADLYAAFLGPQGNTSDSAGPGVAGSTKQAANPGPALDDLDLAFSPSTPAKEVPRPNKGTREPSPLWQRQGHGNDVLFDADEPGDDDNDDFGAFEAVDTVDGDGAEVVGEALMVNHGSNDFPRSPNLQRPGTGGLLLPDLSDADSFTTRPHDPSLNMPMRKSAQDPASTPATDPSWGEDWGDFEETRTAAPPAPGLPGLARHSDPRIPAEVPLEEAEDAWEPFEDGEPALAPNPPSVASRPSETNPASVSPSVALPAFEKPTNIPPPSSLLQLLSSVFDSIRKTNASQTASKPELASQILVVYRTASRIVAGRSQRWKRDTILAQSVRIGQAGKKGGMKLATVNRSESAKEERDVEEMIRDWSGYAHEFNSILAQAAYPSHRMKLSASPSLTAMKPPAGPAASKSCALCGLRRNERLADVDVDIDDIFGEFWTEHWGHNDCRAFWYSYKDLLGQR